MANAKKVPMAVEFDGRVMILSTGKGDEQKVVRRFDADDVPTELHEQLFLFGFKTKVMNYKAGAKDKGLDPLAMMDEGFERLCDGDWAKEREGGGPTVSPLVEALARIRKVDVGVMQRSLQKYTKDQRKAILANEQVVAEAARIKAARDAAEIVDLDDMV